MPGGAELLVGGDSVTAAEQPGGRTGARRTRGGKRGSWSSRAGSIAGITSLGLGIALWELLGRTVWKDSLWVQPFSQVVTRFRELWSEGRIQPDLIASAKAYSVGLAIAIVAGLLLGLATAASKFLNDCFEPYLSIWNATPTVALAPLIILVFGLGTTSRVVVVVLVTTIPVILNTRSGISTTDRKLIEMTSSFGGSRWQVYRHVSLPNAFPHVLTGIRLAASYGFIAIVVGELYTGRAGIGVMIRRASERFDTAALYVGVGLLGIGGCFVTYFLRWLERRLAPWRARQLDD